MQQKLLRNLPLICYLLEKGLNILNGFPPKEHSMQVNNDRPYVNLVAGQLYSHQVASLPPVKDARALFTEFFQALNNPVAAPQDVKPNFIAEATEAFKAMTKDAEGLDNIITFWNNVTEAVKTAEDPEAARKAAESTLGKCLFLLDFGNLDELVDVVAGENPQHALNEYFVSVLKNEAKELETRVNDLKKFDIVSEPNTLRANLLPAYVAELVLTSSQFFNSAIAGDVTQALFLRGELANQKEVERVLTALTNKEECYTILNSIANADNKQLYLEAILSYVGATGAQNSSSVLFSQLSKQANLTGFCQAMKEIIENGFYEKKVDGYTKSFRFDIAASSSSLEKVLSTSNNGSITDKWGVKVGYNTNDRLWQVHGVRNAAEAMEIEDVEAAVKEALQQLGGENPPRRFNITPKALIAAMAKGDQALIAAGNEAFTATYENPIVATWLHAISTIAQAGPKSELVARVHNAVGQALGGYFTSQDIHERASVTKLFANFMASVKESLLQQVPADGKTLQTLCIKALPEEEHNRPAIKAVLSVIKTAGFSNNLSLKELAQDPRDLTRAFHGTQSVVFEAKNARSLLTSLLERAKAKKENVQSYLAAPAHALVFTQQVANFDATKALVQADAIVQTFVKQDAHRQEIFSWVKAHLLDKNFHEEFAKDVAAISKNPTFDGFRHELFTVINSYIQGEGFEQAKQELDNFLVTKMYQKENKLAVSFARSTMKQLGEETEFCLYPDPITGDIAVGRLANKMLTRLEQGDWFSGEWEYSETKLETAV